eukprot:GHVS01096094.1.p2 GENE.GHVS01096094.1~~GHVS01096094.1.p2  ORF type:complete len:147 (-),score=26.41 GHVS01096094.1:994-1434(-)
MTLPDLSPPADMKTSLSRDGFAVCRNFFSKQIMLELRQRCLDLVDDFTPPTSTSQQHSSTFSTSPEDRTGGEFLMASADEIRFFVEKDNSKVFVDNLYSINKIGHALHEKDPVFRKRTQEGRNSKHKLESHVRWFGCMTIWLCVCV